MRLIKVAASTAIATVGAVALVIGIDWLWQAGASSQMVATAFGDPTIVMATSLPQDPGRVKVYRIGKPLTVPEVLAVIPGRARRIDGYLYWHGASDLSPVDVMRRLNPGVPWRAEAGRIGPAPPGGAHGVTTRGLSGAFTGSAAISNSFGVYAVRGKRLVFLSIPDHHISATGWVRVIPPSKALIRLLHHRPGTTVLAPTIPLLPWRLTGDPISRPGPIDDVRLVQAQDPTDLSRSRPIWVFGDVGEVPASP